MSLPTDITLDASTAIAAGSALGITFSQIGGGTVERTIRSDSSVSLVTPHELSIGHLKRSLKGFKTYSNASVPAPDVNIHRHTIRLDYTQATTFVHDPDSRCKSSVQITLEVPRIGADTPGVAHYSDQLKRIVSFLLQSGGGNLQRLLNNES